jgi:hypothetical protein
LAPRGWRGEETREKPGGGAIRTRQIEKAERKRKIGLRLCRVRA